MAEKEIPDILGSRIASDLWFYALDLFLKNNDLENFIRGLFILEIILKRDEKQKLGKSVYAYHMVIALFKFFLFASYQKLENVKINFFFGLNQLITIWKLYLK